MNESYANIEDKLLRMTDINQVESIVPLLQQEGIMVEDVDDIFKSPFLHVGGVLMGVGSKVYFIKDLYENISNFNNSLLTEEYLIDEQIEKLEPSAVIRHFSNIPILPSTDKVILENAYRLQYKNTYKALLNIVKESVANNEEMKIDRIDKEYNGLPLIKDIGGISTYKRFYLGVINSKEFVLVTIQDSGGNIFQHIKMDLDLNTGEALLLVKKNPGTLYSNWRTLVIPFHAIPHLLYLAENNPLRLKVDKIDLISSSRVGKVSGFGIGTNLDLRICNYLGVKEIYVRGKLIEQQEDETTTETNPTTDISTTSWFGDW